MALAACTAASSDDDGVDISSDALVAGHGGIAGPVKVEPTRLVIQRAGNEALLESAGRVLVGAPQSTSGNAYGFLRRVTSAKETGDGHIAIETTNAALGDVVKSGSLHTAHDLEPSSLVIHPMSNGSATPSGKGLDIKLGETVIEDSHHHFKDPTRLLPVGEFDISRKVVLKNAAVHFEPTIELDLAMAGGHLSRLDAVAKGSLEASFAMSIDDSFSVEIDRNAQYRETLKDTFRHPPISVTLFQTEPYVLPVQFIGWVPVIETVRFRVALECDADLLSQLHMDTGSTLKSTAAFGVRYRNGEWKPVAEPTFDANPTLSMAHKGSIQGSCGLRTEVGFFLYDLAGPTLSITPYLDFKVSDDTKTVKGWDWSATPGIRGAFGGELQVFGHEVVRADIALFDKRYGRPFTGLFAP